MNKLWTRHFLFMVYIPKRLFLCACYTKKGIYDIMNLCIYPKEKKNQKKSCICLMYLLYYTHKDETDGAKEAVIR